MDQSDCRILRDCIAWVHHIINAPVSYNSIMQAKRVVSVASG